MTDTAAHFDNPGASLQKRNHIFAVIAATVLVLGLVRAIMLVTHVPVLGYVNPGAPEGGAHAMGFIALALVAGVAAVTALALRAHPVASIVHALLFFLLVADPVATLWLNSENPERWALLGAYAGAAMTAVLALGHRGPLHWAVLGVGIVALLAGLAMPAHDPAGAALTPGQSRDAMVASEPVRSMMGIARNAAALGALAPASLDVSASARIQRLPDLPPRVMSFTGLVSTLPATAVTMIAMAMILTWPFAIYWLSWSARRRPPGASAVPALYVVLTSILVFGAVSASVAGAGDIARQQWLGALAMLAAIAILPLAISELSRDFWAGRIGAVIAFGIILLAASWFAWSRTAPLAIGGVERMTAGTNHTLDVSGWALDPRGVKRVYATVGGGPETTATLGTERRDLQAAYPGYPGAITGGFQMTIASNAWREGQSLRIYVENRTGAVTEIDRRDVRLAP